MNDKHIEKIKDDKIVAKIHKLAMDIQNMYKYSTSDKAERFYTEKEDVGKEKIIGYTGEYLFGQKYNLEACLEVFGTGDGYVDFKVKLNDEIPLSIDVKTFIVELTEKKGNLLVKKWEVEEDKGSDIYVLGIFKDNKTVQFVGWTSKYWIKQSDVRVFSRLGIPNHYVHHSKLFTMEELDLILKNPRIRINQINHRET